MTTYRVRSAERSGWDVTAPRGRRWSGAPSQRAAFALASSLAGIDTMLATIQADRPPLRSRVGRAYGCYAMPSKARS